MVPVIAQHLTLLLINARHLVTSDTLLPHRGNPAGTGGEMQLDEYLFCPLCVCVLVLHKPYSLQYFVSNIIAISGIIKLFYGWIEGSSVSLNLSCSVVGRYTLVPLYPCHTVRGL